MVFLDLFVALAIALLLTAILLPLAGWRGQGPRTPVEAASGEPPDGAVAGTWAAALLFFLIVFLAAWAGGVWFRPAGALAWDASWLGFLVVGFLVALVLLSVTPSHGGWGRERPRIARTGGGELEREAGLTALAAGVGIFFWALLVFLAVAIVVAYLV